MKNKLKVEEAMKVLQEENEKKVRACNAEIQAILEKYGMKIDVQSAVTLIPKI